jgi:hypothetical protein
MVAVLKGIRASRNPTPASASRWIRADREAVVPIVRKYRILRYQSSIIR